MPDLDPMPTLDSGEWVFPDGTRLPLVAGASDNGPADVPDLNAILDRAEAGDPAPAPEPAATPAEPAAPAPAEVPEPTLEEKEAQAQANGLDSLPEEWQKHVRDARKEAERYRLRAKDYESAFEGVDDDGRQFLLDLNKAIAKGDVDTAQRMWDALFAGDPAPDPTDTPAAAGEALTAADVERLVEERIAAREAKAQADAAVREIETEAKSLGYTPGSRDYVNLLFVANNETDGDIAKAHESLQAERQKVIDAYLAEKAGDAEKHTTAAPGTGAAPSGERQISDLKQSKAALEEWLAAQ